MSKIQQIPSGYKSSPLGLIPDDWEVKRLEDISFVQMGQSPDSENYNSTGGGLPLIQGNADMKSGESIQRIWTTQITKTCYIGDIILSVRAPVGTVGKASFDSCIGRGVCALRGKSIDHLLLFYLLQYREPNWASITQGSTFESITGEQVKNSLFVVPTLPEQAAIANLLSIWDEAISKTSALIGQYELRKKGFIMQLFTEGKQLGGFSQKWERESIGKFSQEVSIRNRNNSELTVLSCTKYDGLVSSLEYFGRKIFSDDLSTYKVVPENHFAYATNHIEEGSIGYQSTLPKALISPMYTVFKTDSSVINDKYLFRLLKSHIYIHEYQRRMEGSIDRRGGLRWDEFSKIKVPIPSLEEQSLITEILDKSDEEISLLKSKLEKLKEQKNGLMQQLLTGKKRLQF